MGGTLRALVRAGSRAAILVWACGVIGCGGGGSAASDASTDATTGEGGRDASTFDAGDETDAAPDGGTDGATDAAAIDARDTGMDAPASDGSTTCDPSVDEDADGLHQCMDCDDTNGSVGEGFPEVCDGVDNDCDLSIDEDFDVDGDGFATCTTDPLLRDCDDGVPTTHPGASEQCGNDADDDCNGSVDETCGCTSDDEDDDGFSACDGDCDDADPVVFPGNLETCDGVDNDCNSYTTANCGRNDPCYRDGPDVCEPDLVCACPVDEGDTCTGPYRCRGFCSGSFTADAGFGCERDEVCLEHLRETANVNVCTLPNDPVGARQSGDVCESGSECRSSVCTGTGPMDPGLCAGPCDHHAPGEPGSCAAGSACVLFAAPDGTLMSQCGGPVGLRATGESCTMGITRRCIWGALACVDGVCAQPCGVEAHCPEGTHCSFFGNDVQLGPSWGGSIAGVSGEPVTETVPVCVGDSAGGTYALRAGAACTTNAACASGFCDDTSRVCVEPCRGDGDCPNGLACELELVATRSGVTRGLVCVHATRNGLWQPL